jgi:hypothetical protein
VKGGGGPAILRSPGTYKHGYGLGSNGSHPLKDGTNQLESTINWLEEFLSSETALAIARAQQTTVPFTNALNRDGQIFLIRIPVGELGDLQARFYTLLHHSHGTCFIVKVKKGGG